MLLDDSLDGTPYERLDLTNIDSVAAVATNLVVDAISQALGDDVGLRIAAVAGIIAPEVRRTRARVSPRGPTISTSPRSSSTHRARSARTTAPSWATATGGRS